MTEYEIFEHLKPRFPKNEYVLIPQVRNSTGFSSRTRTADALAISLWPSRGVHVEGFEFKDSRSDWQRELADPAKSEEIGRFCFKWWIVASSITIVADDEVPSGWGLLVIKNGKLCMKKAAPPRETEKPTWPFVASVIRAARDRIMPEVEVEKRIAGALKQKDEELQARIDASVERATKRLREELEQHKAIVAGFEKHSGIAMSRWTGDGELQRIGSAIKAIVRGGLPKDHLRHLSERMASLKEQCDKLLDTIPEDANATA